MSRLPDSGAGEEIRSTGTSLRFRPPKTQRTYQCMPEARRMDKITEMCGIRRVRKIRSASRPKGHWSGDGHEARGRMDNSPLRSPSPGAASARDDDIRSEARSRSESPRGTLRQAIPTLDTRYSLNQKTAQVAAGNATSTVKISTESGDKWIAYDAVPVEVRRFLQQAVADWCPIKEMRTWREIRRYVHSDAEATHLYLEARRRAELGEIEQFSCFYETHYMQKYAHTAACASILR